MADQKFINIQIIGMGEFRRKIETLRMLVKSPQFAKLMHEFAHTGKAFAMKLAPKQSYLLMSRIEGTVRNLGTNEPAIVLGVRGLKYAAAMETGAKPHTIVPRNKKWLRWFSEGYKGKTVHVPAGVHAPAYLYENWRKRVNHPGNKPQPYLVPAITRLRPLLIQAMKRMLTDIFPAKPK